MSYTFTLQEKVSLWVDRVVEVPKEVIEDIKQQTLENDGSIEDFEDAVKDWIEDHQWENIGDSEYLYETEDSLDWQFEEDSYANCIGEIVGDYEEEFNMMQEGLVGEIQ